MYKIYLNDDVIRNFRNTINDYIDFSLTKKYKNNDKIGKVYIYLNDDIIYSNDIYIEKENKSIFTKIKNIFTTIVDKIF